jgi:hypothetical protein
MFANMSSSELKVAIIGCGISVCTFQCLRFHALTEYIFKGLTLALSLRTYGIRCEIYEMRPKESSQGGSITLSPNSLRALDGLDVFEAVHARGFDM